MTPGTARGGLPLAQALVHKIDLVGTLAAIAEEMEDVQASRNVRTFHALHERIARVVRHNPVPFLFERMGSAFRHVFIDEFQDTSVTQWQNLIPLVDHVLSERNGPLWWATASRPSTAGATATTASCWSCPTSWTTTMGLRRRRTDVSRRLDDQLLDANWRSGSAIVAWNGRF